MKPLEIKDFSGGLTDNYFQGEPTRAEKLENLLIGIDHRLSTRPGTLVKNNAAKAERVNSIETFNSFEDLVYSSEGHFYDIDGAEILGPSGNIAFVGATPDAAYTSAEFQGQLILAPDETLQPQKIYKDQSGSLQVRTVGLPKVSRPKISDADLLTECINAANFLRQNFLNHINSAENLDAERDGTSATYSDATEQPPTSTKAHWSIDKYAKSYFEAVIFFPATQWQPATLPTPAPAATDYNTLVALLKALNFAFEEHRQDSAGFAATDETTSLNFNYGPNRYHALGYQTQFTDFTSNFGFPYVGLINEKAKPLNQGIQQKIIEDYNPDSAVNASTPESEVYRTKLIAAANFLDDFAVKFSLHEAAPFVHRYNSQNTLSNPLVSAAFGYKFIAPLLTEKPVIIPTPFNFIYASNYVQRAFKNHALNTDKASLPVSIYPTMHSLANDSIVSGLPQAGYFFASLPPTPSIREQYAAFAWDVILAKLAIFTARYSYFIHTLDLQLGFEDARVDMDLSGGVPTNYTVHLKNTIGGTNYVNGLKGQAILSNFGNRTSNATPKKQSFNGLLSNDGAGNYHVNFSAIGFTYTNFSLGSFIMHPYPLMSGNTSFPNFTSTNQSLNSFGYAPDIYDLASWIGLIQTFYNAFKVHLSTTNTHYHVATSYFEFQPTPAGETVPEGGVQYFPLSSLLPTVNLKYTDPQFFIPEIVSYGYAFTYSDSYTLENDISYKVESAPVFTTAVNSEETLGVGVTKAMYGEATVFITNEIITPVAMVLGADTLINTASTNYSTTPLNVAQTLLNMYRTTGNGKTFSKVNLLPATTLDTTPSGGGIIALQGSYDLVSDVYAINGNIPLNDSLDILYTNGGISPSDQPPKCKYVWQANGYTYYGAVYDGDTFLPNRVLQSVQLAPDWVPSTAYVDFDSPVVGGGAARNVNVCMTETGVFRLEGAFAKTANEGSIVKQQISNQIGGISGASIVVTEIGIFFAGTNGFYYTDGYQCIRISQELFKTYQNATATAAQRRDIKGSYDRVNRRVYWTMRSTSAQTDCDVMFVFDMNFGITPSGAFVRLKGATGSWNPSSIAFKKDTLYIGDSDGFLYYSDANTKTDPSKDVLTAPNTWGDTYIPWEYRSTMMDFGGTAMRKFFSRIHHVGKNLGDVAIQYYITADNRVTQDLAPMRFIDNGGTGVVDQWRRVGGKKLRADLYQVGVRNGRFTVYNSDTYGGTPVFVSNVLGVTTLTMTGAVLPLDSVGMAICFASDYYATEFTILSVAVIGPDTTITVTDTLNEANALLTLAWEIRGFMKEQAFSLDALTIWFEEQGNLGSQYRGYSSEEGGGGNK